MYWCVTRIDTVDRVKDRRLDNGRMPGCDDAADISCDQAVEHNLIPLRDLVGARNAVKFRLTTIRNKEILITFFMTSPFERLGASLCTHAAWELPLNPPADVPLARITESSSSCSASRQPEGLAPVVAVTLRRR